MTSGLRLTCLLALVCLSACPGGGGGTDDAGGPSVPVEDGGETSSCSEDCATIGEQLCDGTGGFRICGQLDSDRCLDLTTSVVSCNAGQVCEAGACKTDTSCTDLCTGVGSVVCDGTSGTRTCGNFDSDGCLELSPPVACPSGTACGNGTCQTSTSCVDDCSPSGVSLCDPNGGFRTCGNFDADSCLELSSVTACASNEACSGGHCVQVCTDECQAGTQVCSGSGAVKICGNFDADPCKELSAVQACATFENCVNDACVACQNDCPSVGNTQCDGQGGFKTCGNFDADSCFELSATATACGAGETCSSGTCQLPCQDECTGNGTTACVGSQVKTCGNHDADSCLEWSTAAACNGGGTCVADLCQAPNAPSVNLLSPQGTVQVTQGQSVRMLVDVTPAAGRSISEVRYFADGAQQGTSSASPHSFDFVVPASAATGSTLTLQVKAVDNQGTVGVSSFARLTVKNDPPVASFTATIANANIVQVDASSATDTETSAAQLLVCWDWDNDGNCDTTYSTEKLATHDFGTAGTFTIGMKVKDAVGQVSSATRQVSFADVSYAGGSPVTTTTWYGTVVVTGQVVVPAGNTLTIASGTQVLFVKADTNPIDGVGDYGIDIQGKLDVQGTAQAPVLFSGQSTAAKSPGSWGRIVLSGATVSSLVHAVVEYAEVGVVLKNASSLSHVTVRSTKSDCIALDNGDGASLDTVTTTLCGRAGVSVNNGSTGVTVTGLVSKQNTLWGLWASGASSATVTSSLIQDNGEDGLWVGTGTSLDLSDSTVEGNAKTGLAFVSTSAGTVTRNQIRNNQHEGVALVGDATGEPNPVVNLNNLYSNAQLASNLTTRINPGISASTTVYGNPVVSSTYTAPPGATIRRVRVVYDEYDGSGSVNGALLDGNNVVLTGFTYDYNGWLHLPPGATAVKVRVYDSGYSNTLDRIEVAELDLVSLTGSSDVTTSTVGGTPDFRYNYLGTFPNVLSRVALNRTNALDLQGFVGDVFASDWSRGPYKAGTVNTESWSGTVYVTGNITLPGGQELTVQPGTQVLFVKHDQNIDGTGDFTLTANGKLTVGGTSASPVGFRAIPGATGNAFQKIVLAGTGPNVSSWSHVQVANGKIGLELTGASNLSQLTVQGGTQEGLVLTQANAAKLTDVTVSGAGTSGVVVDNSDAVELTRLTIESSVGHGLVVSNGSDGAVVSRLTSRLNGSAGLYVANGSTPLVEDSTLRENGGHGLEVLDASPTVNHSLITYNQKAGLWLQGSGSTQAQYNVIKFNHDSGVAVFSTSAGSHTPLVQYSNLYGNSVNGSTVPALVDPSATLAASTTVYGNPAVSGTYTAPAGSVIRRVRVTYDEYDGSGSVNGALLDGNSVALTNFTSDFGGWLFVPANTTTLKVRVYDSGYSNTLDTISVPEVELVSFDTAARYELVASTITGTSLAKFNYWTASVGDVPSKVLQTRAASVDFTGYTGAEYPNLQVTQVGPRP